MKKILLILLFGVYCTNLSAQCTSAPATPGDISGITSQCPGLTGQAYSIAAVSGATSYTWYVPTGWSITSGQGTRNITVTTGNSSQSGNISVTASNACGTSNHKYQFVGIYTQISTNSPSVNNISNVNCGYAMLTWNQVSNAVGYYLDIATDSGFTNFVAGYKDFNVAYNSGSSPVYNIPHGTVYYRIRAYDNCKISNYSNTGTIAMNGSSGSGTLASSQSICSGTKPADLVLTGNTTPVIRWESSTDIGFSNIQTIASTSTTLTGNTIGNLTQSTYFRAVSSQMTSAPWCNGYSSVVLITVLNRISPASSSPTPCINTVMTNITHTTSGFTGIGAPTNLPLGVSASFANNIVTISGTPTVSGTFNYTIPLTGGSCGPANATGTIIVYPLPSAADTITGSAIVCQSQTNVNYSVPVISNATSYNWSYTGSGATFTNGSTNNPTITFASNATSGILRVRGVNSCGNGTYSADYPITVNTISVAPTGITGTTTICNGGSTTLTVNGGTLGTGATVQWFTGSCGGTSAGTGNSITVSPTSNTTYYVRYSGTCNTTTCASQLVTVNSPSVTPTGISGTTTICNGNSTTLTLTGGTSGSGATARWYSGSCGGTLVGTGNSISVSPTTTTNYYVRYEGTCNTTTCASTTVTVNFPSVAPTGITGTTTICNGGSTTLTVNGGTLGTGATVQWFTGSCGGTSAGTGNSITVSPTSNTTYYVRYSGTCNTTTCASQLVTVNSLPGTPAATAATDVTCSSFLANWAAASNATGYYLDVSTVNNFSGILPAYNGLDIGLVSSYNVTGLDKKTTYFYRLRAYNSCSSSVNSNYIQIKTLDVPKATISGTTAVCRNAASPVITFSNSEDSPITVTYNINGGANSTINVGANATATVSVPTGASGTFTYNLVSAAYQSVTSCLTSLSGSATVTVNPTPTPTFTTAAQAQTCADTHITYATQSGQSNYVWTVSGVLNTDYRLIARGTSTNHDIVIEWLTAGSKTVTVNYNNSNGCSGASPATYTTNVQVVDRGQVNGGRENLCKGDALPTLTLHSIAGNTIAYPDASLVLKWQYSDNADNSDWQDIAGTAGQISYSPTAFPGAFRTYQVVLQSSNGCTKTSIPSRIRFQAFSPPTNGVVINTSCTGSTGSVVLNGLPTGNWTLYRTGTSNATITGTGASITISNLAAGSYSFTYREGNCTSDPLVVTITRAANTWDGTKWSKTNNTTLPTADDSIVFEGNYTVTSDISACSCTVNSGSVVVNSGRTLTITNEVTVNGGSLTFENNASLIQTTNAINSGSIIYKRSSQPMKRYDFTYWSSPVAGQTLYSLSPNTRWDKYLSYTGDVWKEELSSGVMQPGIGYIIRVPEPNVTYPNGESWSGASYAQTLSFTGRPNNGVITSSQYMEKDKYYLIGNPYPSAIHADAFLYDNVNNRGILGGTVYFWTHNTAIKLVGPKYAYVSDDYASYNLTGGVASAPSDPNHNVSGADNGLKPTGYIGAGQSFFTSAESGSGNVEFTNEMRYGGTHNSQFFKPGKTSRSASMEKHRLWLNLTNAGGAFKQTLIGYIEGATNTYDKIFDGLTYDGNSYIDFYSINEASDLTIQGRALPFTDADVVPLGYRSTIAGEFTIAIDQADGSLATQRVYLEDKQLGTINELTAKNYTFTTKAGTFKNRFVLRYKNNTLGTGDFETTEDAVSVLAQNKTVTVNSTAENIEKVFLYDLSGKLLYSRDNVNNLQLIMQNLSFAQQVLLVKVVLDNGYQTTKKVIFK